ncbi:glyoxylate/hydroxypyruvate reductase A [Cobetia sp. 4B]|uniref:2-hydroxyacid dehydrogenase n=1 Tax=Cobetia sp. 4B TaxID=2758724 RepID=UPI001C04A2C9|nr:glyoxylate/hydroxypyruvate reductase A [Cobetia sp. 4B]MBR9755903.1 glyoxylate/hydroxypyruvate reductase A [Gammaproteobacteria bacterium]QWN36412.1 glyoxylate/hydroxypyruvate reductase A [Cobetia sp. 4B]
MRILVHHERAERWCDALRQRLCDAAGAKGSRQGESSEPSSEPSSKQAPLEIVADDGEMLGDVLVVWTPPAALFERHRDHDVKAILNLGAGVDSLLANPALPDDVPVLKLSDAGMASHMLDYVRYGLLHFRRDFDRYARQQADTQWAPHRVVRPHQYPVAVLGLGAIGSQIAESLAADGYPVHGFSRSAHTLQGVTCHHETGAGGRSLKQVLGDESLGLKAVINLLPNTPATRDVLNAEVFQALPDDAVLINPGRGSSVVEEDLVAALEEGKLRGALLDVFQHEPLAEDSPLWQQPRVIITPHAAAPTPVAEAADQLADNIRRIQRGEVLTGISREHGY